MILFNASAFLHSQSDLQNVQVWPGFDDVRVNVFSFQLPHIALFLVVYVVRRKS